MTFKPEALVVIAFYVLCLYVILRVWPRLQDTRPAPTPWYRRVSFWGCVVAVVQIVIYAIWS